MNLNELLAQKGITKYRLAKSSGIPQTTVIDICSGKTRIEKCSGETLYKLAKILDVSIETLLEDAMGYRPGFEAFKSNVCHMVHDMGELNFIAQTLESNRISELWEKRWYAESLYLLSMVDYLCRENDLPVCAEYAEMRRARLSETLYPASILTLCAAMKIDMPKTESLNEAIPEFLRFNIVENEVRQDIGIFNERTANGACSMADDNLDGPEHDGEQK